MKKLILLLLLATAVFALPQPTGVVNDYAKIIEPEWKLQLESLISSIEQNTTAEIAIVTVESLGDKSVEETGLQYLEEWGVGKKGNDNGIVILVAPNDREYRIEVGYGAEGAINDARAGRIGRDILALYFKEKRYGEGLYNAVEEIGGLLRNDPEIMATYTPKYEFFSTLAPFLFVFGFILTGIIGLIASKRETKQQKITTFLIADLLLIAAVFAVGFIVPHSAYLLGGLFFTIFGIITLVRIISGGSGGGGFIFLGGGRGSGGFGGFGGGSGGGGGASGKW